MAQAGQALGRKREQRLRRLERLARRKAPREAEIIDAHLHARHVERVHFGMQIEIARILEGHADRLALRLRGGRAREYRARVQKMPARIAQRFDLLHAVMQRLRMRMALAGPCSGEFGHRVVTVGQVEIETHHAFEADRLASAVRDAHAARDDRLVAENRVLQGYGETCRPVDELDFQRGRLIVMLHIRCRQSRKSWFAGDDAIAACVCQIGEGRSVALPDFQRRPPVVAATVFGEFLTHPFQRVGEVAGNAACGGGRMRHLRQITEILTVRYGCAEIQIDELALPVGVEDVADPTVGQMELPSMLVHDDGGGVVGHDGLAGSFADGRLGLVGGQV